MQFCIWLNLQFWEICLHTNTTQNVLEPRNFAWISFAKHKLHLDTPCTITNSHVLHWPVWQDSSRYPVDKTTLYIVRLSALCVMLNRRRIKSRRWVRCETWLLSWTKQNSNSGNVFKIYLLAHTISAQCTYWSRAPAVMCVAGIELALSASAIYTPNMSVGALKPAPPLYYVYIYLITQFCAMFVLLSSSKCPMRQACG